MNEEKFWLCVWGMVLSFFAVVAFCITFNAYWKRDKWEKAVSNGADPIIVSCALNIGRGADAAICAILAQERK